MVLRVAITLTALAFGLAAGGWMVAQANPATSLSAAESAVRLAFPDAGTVRDPAVVPGFVEDAPEPGIGGDGHHYQGFEFLVRSGSGGRAELVAEARAALEAAGWRTWELGPDGDLAAAGGGLGLATESVGDGVVVTVGAVNSLVWPAALATGLVLAVVAWLVFPVVWRGRRHASVVAAVSVVAMLPATFITLYAAVTSPFGAGPPWSAPWVAFMLGTPPLALIAALVLVGSGATAVLARRIQPSMAVAAAGDSSAP